ncbi:Peptide transporter family 1 [Eumeta japonica]|uniref:Peptide transporter family 1 n=1 Tax=Eumeta variegata TaxID=151549 RepID=A0A4C1TZB8_EUMVA|nr:Peptide transporter family 1 [Eumeta japonica]
MSVPRYVDPQQKTILNMMFIYAAGNSLVALAAIPQLALPARLCTMIGLFMVTVGTGGIKPCVTAFGGDQFKLPEQEHHLAVFFSVLYFILCLGSLIAKTISPILRSEVHCFGDKDCYSLAFGAPGFVVLLSIVVFVSSKNKYVIKKPEGNVVVDFVKCVSLGIKNVLLNRKKYEKCLHWLDSTEVSYDNKFVADVKKTLSILCLFSVLPVFWALLDQMGSRWTLQATKMDGRFGFITVKPDQMQVIAPIFILILIPLMQKIYPKLEKRNILKNPLHRLTLGEMLAGAAFIASGLVELYLRASTSYPQLPQPGFSQFRLFNGHPCSIAVNSDAENITYTIPPLSYYVNRNIKVDGHKNLSLELGGTCAEPAVQAVSLEEHAAISVYYSPDGVARYRDRVDKSKAGFPIVRFLVSGDIDDTTLALYNEKRHEVESYISRGVSELHEAFASTYSLRAGNTTVGRTIELENGGVYTILLRRSKEGYYYLRRHLTACSVCGLWEIRSCAEYMPV